MPTTVSPFAAVPVVTGPPRADRRPQVRSVSIGMVGTYPPTRCGLATFGAALVEALRSVSVTVGVVQVVERAEPVADPETVTQWVTGSAASAARAVHRLNAFDAVVVQHEYGIYGGPDGADVLDVVDALSAPVIVVTHTVLQDPTSRQRRILLRLLDRAEAVVTMTETARLRLIASYGADPRHVSVIPHGAPDHGFVSDHGRRRTPSRAEGRPVILTWGLLGPGKGIEWAIDAVSGLRDLNPQYLVVGRTHPKVAERDGEAYRRSLLARVAARGVGDLVELDDRYPDAAALAAMARAADVVLLPYDSREQVTSGVLIEAVAAGRPVVSTAFPHAVEMLGDGTGLVVPQRDPGALEAALRRVIEEPGLAAELAARASRKAPELLWGAVAQKYRQLASGLAARSSARSSGARSASALS